jgi:hypothetical protein
VRVGASQSPPLARNLNRAALATATYAAYVADESLIASPPEDPVLALIAEEKRLDALWDAATTRGDEIFCALPEDIRKGRVQVSFSAGPWGTLLDGGFTSEAALHRLVGKVRRLGTAACED